MEELVVWVIVILFGFALVYAIIRTAIHFWYITLPLVAIFLAIVYAVVSVQGYREQKAEELARLQRRREEQEGYYNKMVVLGERSIGAFELLPKELEAAEKCLDKAEVEFADRAFAPFWDAVEEATERLARFTAVVREMQDDISRYTEMSRKYEGVPPRFPLARQSIERLRVGSATAKRLQAIVRRAQRDFQFATIYEQRKTNEILVAGFTNLANALNDMTWRITESIDNLTSSVDGMTSTLNASMQTLNASMQGIHARMGDIHERISTEGSEIAARQQKALEMLDNIQRGRRPPPGLGPVP